MKTTILALILIIFLSANCASAQQQVPAIEWQKFLPGVPSPSAMIQSYDGGFLMAGSNTITKVSAAGTKEWDLTMSASITSLIRTSDGQFLCGGNGGGNIFVAKFSRSGSIIWQRNYGGTNTETLGNVKQFTNGDFYLIGTTNSIDGDVSGHHPQIDGFGNDIWVVRFNNAGSIVWQRCFGGVSDDMGYDIAPAENGNFVIATTLYSNEGDFGVGAGNPPRGYVIKIDSNSNMVWKDLLQRATPNTLTMGAPNQYLVKYDLNNCYPMNPNNGVTVLTKASVGAPPGVAGGGFSMCQPNISLPNYNYWSPGPYTTAWINISEALLVGYTSDPNNPGAHGGDDGIVTGLGSKPWKKMLGGTGSDILTAVVVINENEFLVAGSTSSTDGDVVGNTGGAWLVKFGRINSIKGTVFLDHNSNGIKESNEPIINNIQVESGKGSIKVSTLTANGYFRNAVDTGTYNTSIKHNVPYYTAVPSSKNSFFSTYNNFDSIGFALQPIPNQRDYKINLYNMGMPRPGFDLVYKIECVNVGTDTLSNRTIKLVKSNKLDFLSSVPAQSSIVNDTISWAVASLQPRETAFITVNVRIKAPPIANIGDLLLSTASIDTSGDLSHGNNSSTLRQIVGGSFDPNDKGESKGGTMYMEDVSAGKELSYTIRFQNTGNDTAFNVVLRDTLDQKVDSNSIEMVEASHPYELTIKDGNKLTWTFTDILLPDSNRNEPASHGYIIYRIKPKSTLAIGDTIKNSASIYFDFNLPVKTNTQITVIKLAPPPQPVVTGIQNNYCSNHGIQKGKITNLPSASSGTTAIAKLDGSVIPIAADSSFSFDVSTMSAGSHSAKVIYSNSTSSDSVIKTFTVTSAVTPDVNVSANITNITSLANPVVVTAANAAGGGSTPLYTFAKDRTFTTILQAEGNNNVLNINPSDLQVGDNWIYVRMKTSLTCYTTQTNVDSILLKRDAVTGIIDVNDPGRVINIYPNPFNRQININGLNPTKSYEITIVDLNGKQLLKKQIQNSTQYNLQLRSYPGGAYLLNVYDKRKQRLIGNVRLVKQ